MANPTNNEQTVRKPLLSFSFMPAQVERVFVAVMDRLHWGKFVPRYDFKRWAKHYSDNLPHFGDFMNVRKERDPDGVFFTDYWQSRLTGSPDTGCETECDTGSA